MGDVRCPTCFYEASWEDGQPVVVHQEGGVRAPSPHPSLAALRVWVAARGGHTGPVVGVCPQCHMPLILTDGDADASPDALLTSPKGDLQISMTHLEGPDGPISDDEALALFEAQFQPRVIDQFLDWRIIFLVAVLGIFALIFVIWLGAAAYVTNFLYAMGTQGNFSAPSVP